MASRFLDRQPHLHRKRLLFPPRFYDELWNSLCSQANFTAVQQLGFLGIPFLINIWKRRKCGFSTLFMENHLPAGRWTLDALDLGGFPFIAPLLLYSHTRWRDSCFMHSEELELHGAVVSLPVPSRPHEFHRELASRCYTHLSEVNTECSVFNLLRRNLVFNHPSSAHFLRDAGTCQNSLVSHNEQRFSASTAWPERRNCALTVVRAWNPLCIAVCLFQLFRVSGVADQRSIYWSCMGSMCLVEDR